MIQLTRLNNQPLVVNSDMIKFVENAPDTVLTLVSGEKLVVLESTQEVLQKVIDFRRTVAAGTVNPTQPPSVVESQGNSSLPAPPEGRTRG